MYSILIEDKIKISRDVLMKRLEEKGIETRPFFDPMHLLPMYSSNEKLPVAEELARKGLNLPSSINLNKNFVSYIIYNLRRCLNYG